MMAQSLSVHDAYCGVGLADRGYQVDPNWYQNYIQPGRVNETYAQIMNYAYSFGVKRASRYKNTGTKCVRPACISAGRVFANAPTTNVARSNNTHENGFTKQGVRSVQRNVGG